MKAVTRMFVTVALMAVLALGVGAVVAQDDDLGMADAVVSGDLDSACAVAVQEFFRTRDMSVLGPNVMFSDPDTMGIGMTGMETSDGGDTTGAMGNLTQPMMFDSAAFGDGLYDIRSLVVGDTLVVAEFTFTGTNTGDFMGQAATNIPVSAPAVAIFNCENDAVTEARLYYDRASIMSQMGIDSGMTGADTVEGADTMATEAGMDTAGLDTTGADTAPIDPLAGGDTLSMETLPPDPYALLDAVTDDPAAYMGQTVTVAGPITELAGGLADNGFIIVEEDLIGDDPALIIGATPDLLAGSAWAVDQQVIVTGVVRGMVIADLEAELGYDLADELYAGYENFPVIVASEVGPYDPAAQIAP